MAFLFKNKHVKNQSVPIRQFSYHSCQFCRRNSFYFRLFILNIIGNFVHDSEALLLPYKVDRFICHYPQEPSLKSALTPIFKLRNAGKDFYKTILHYIFSIKVGDLSFEGLELATSKAVVVCSIKMTRNAAAAAAAAAAEEEA